MGFLDNLLKKETRKIISGVVDSVFDNVADNISESIRSGNSSESRGGVNTGTSKTGNSDSRCNEGAIGDDDDCCYNEKIVCSRIESVAAEDWGSLELRKNVSCSILNAEAGSIDYTYGLFRDGAPVAMINVLPGVDDYRRKSVLLSAKACRENGVGYVHFMLKLPNRKTYIAQKLKEIIPE